MKRALIFILLFLTVSRLTCFGQFTNDKHVGAKISGRVRSFTVKSYGKADSADKLITQLIMIHQYDYSKKGQLIRTCVASSVNRSDINRKFVDTAIYDKMGYIKNIIHYDAEGKPNVKEIFVYSRSKRFIIIKQHLYNGDTARFSEQFKLDVYNRIIAMYNYGSRTDTGKMEYNGVTYYKYNKQGFQILKDSYNPDGSRRYYTTITYDKNGNIADFSDYVANREKSLFTGSYQYTRYDSHHNWTTNFHVDVNGKPRGRDERQITYYK